MDGHNSTLFSHRSDEWETPKAFFDELNEEFRFTLDAAATEQNAKCRRWFSATEDGLRQDWGGGDRVYKSAL